MGRIHRRAPDRPVTGRPSAVATSRLLRREALGRDAASTNDPDTMLYCKNPGTGVTPHIAQNTAGRRPVKEGRSQVTARPVEPTPAATRPEPTVGDPNSSNIRIDLPGIGGRSPWGCTERSSDKGGPQSRQSNIAVMAAGHCVTRLGSSDPPPEASRLLTILA